MKTYYLIIALDKLNGKIFNPDPCLFETEEEADLYIRLNENKTISYARTRVRVGKMNSVCEK